MEAVNACFTPTTLRIAPGDAVTFVNRDPIVHNVAANGWGTNGNGLDEGEAFPATFDEPGAYPYACTYHRGMTGAIVVGDGVGDGAEVRVASFAPPEPPPWSMSGPSGRTRPASPAGWFLGGAIGLVLGVGLGLGGRSLVRGRTAL